MFSVSCQDVEGYDNDNTRDKTVLSFCFICLYDFWVLAIVRWSGIWVLWRWVMGDAIVRLRTSIPHYSHRGFRFCFGVGLNFDVGSNDYCCLVLWD
jgi:hypothetical protein